MAESEDLSSNIWRIEGPIVDIEDHNHIELSDPCIDDSFII